MRLRRPAVYCLSELFQMRRSPGARYIESMHSKLRTAWPDASAAKRDYAVRYSFIGEDAAFKPSENPG